MAIILTTPRENAAPGTFIPIDPPVVDVLTVVATVVAAVVVVAAVDVPPNAVLTELVQEFQPELMVSVAPIVFVSVSVEVMVASVAEVV
jgi:hypothetical protein